MRSIKVALATGAVVATTIGGAYAAGAVNKHGHGVDSHAAEGQSVAAAAQGRHGASSDASESPGSEPTESTTTPQAASADESADTVSAPTQKGEHGHHYGRVNPHRHYGHQWGRGHGTGAVVKPDNPNKPVDAHGGHGSNPPR